MFYEVKKTMIKELKKSMIETCKREDINKEIEITL